MKLFRAFIAVLLVLVLAGCSKPLPPEKAAYAGEWQGLGMSLMITPDGSVAYKRMKGGVTTSVDGPLKEFQGNNFLVGLGPLTTTFVVSVPPHEAGGVWKMTVDDVELTRRR